MKETPSNRASVHRGLGFQWMTRAALIGTLVVIGGSEMGCKASGVQQVKRPKVNQAKVKNKIQSGESIRSSVQSLLLQGLQPGRSMVYSDEIIKVDAAKSMLNLRNRPGNTQLDFLLKTASKYGVDQVQSFQKMIQKAQWSEQDFLIAIKLVKQVFIAQRKTLIAHINLLKQYANAIHRSNNHERSMKLTKKWLSEIQNYSGIIKSLDIEIGQLP